MRVAIVDLGTNTFNLLISELNDKGFTVIHKEKQAVKLGKSGINSGVIAEDAFKRGLNAMTYYAEEIKKYNCDQTLAIATSAMRDSKNAPEFIKEVLAETGITIEVISGQREAEFIQKGVALSLPNELTDYVIMDVGGGSTEFIIVKNSEVIWSRSYNLGVSRLLDWLAPSGPISETDIARLTDRLDSELEELYSTIATLNITTLIGSSGSFDSLHDMIATPKNGIALSADLEFSALALDEVSAIHHRLLASTLPERLAMKGLVTMRADMMVISSLEIQTVLNKCKIQKLFRSSFALKEGLLEDLRTSKILE